MTPETLSVVQYVLSSLRRAAENAYSWSLTPNEAGLLVAEVERLRAEVSYLRACVPPMRPTDYGHEVWTAALVEAKKEGARSAVAERVAEERADAVAYLRKRHADTQEWEGCDNATSRTYNLAADAIERGEHHHNPAGKEKP